MLYLLSLLKQTKSLVVKLVSCLLVLCNVTQLPAQQLAKPPIMQEEWSRPFPAFRIVGNVYYVGTYDLASYLITTKDGHILINTGLAESGTMIRSNIESLGFKLNDIKILLATHGHYDHVGAMAEIKRMTDAKMMMQEGDVQVLADGGNSDYVLGGKGSTFAPVKVDRVLKDNDIIRLGDMEIAVHKSAGHTKGAGSFTFVVNDGSKKYKVLIANMPTILDGVKLSGMPGYPNVGKDYANTFAMLKQQSFDIFLSSHASQFGLHKKYKPGDAYDPQKFVDEEGYRTRVEDLEKLYKARLKKEEQ